MSLIGTVANYGGRQPDNFQGIKQFVVGADSLAVWIYKKLPSGLKVQTPADKIRPLYISTDLYVNGSLYNTSDVRLKENIKTISAYNTNGLLDLHPVEFQFKSDVNQQLHYGFIAQDFENEYPELISIKPDAKLANIKAINYLEIIPLLVSKIQMMQKEIDELKASK